MAINETLSADAVKNRISKVYDVIETMFVGVVTSVDPVGMRYGVQPVLNRYDKVDNAFIENAILVDCPMLVSKCADFYLRMPYAIGDMVYVGVSKDSMDESIISATARPNRMQGVQQFRQIDGVILGGLLSDEEATLSSSNTSDFLIQNRKTNDKFVILASGGIELVTKTKVLVDSPETEVTGNVLIKGNTNINGTLTVDGVITGNSNLSISGAGNIGSVTTSKGTTLDGHTHTYNPGPSPPTQTGTGAG